MKTLKFPSYSIAASLAAVVSLSVSSAFAAPIYGQSFDYGASVLDFGTDLSGAGWTDNTGVISYQPSGGLTYPSLSNPSGGALVYSEPTSGDRNASQTLSYNFAGDPSGQVYWMFVAGRINTALTAGGITEMRLDGGSVVNTLAFGFSADTGLFAKAWENSPNALATVAGGSYTVGSTVGFLAKVTKGTGASPSNTTVDFWFNPDLNSLGAANGTIANSRFAREGPGNALNRAYYGGNTGGGYTWDEVRFSKDFGDIVVIPEPGSLSLVLVAGFGMIALLSRRRWSQTI
jgi:hypothetical protein